MAVASQITISEIDGNGRGLVLTGAGLPLRGVEFGVEQRLKTKFLNGNPEAVQHVLGPMLSPTDMEGWWRTTQLIGTPVTYQDQSGTNMLTHASTVVQAWEIICKGGALLQVTWESDDGRQVIRRGRMSKFTPKYDRFDDVKWSATFAWTDEGTTPAAIQLFSGESVGIGELDETIAALNDIATEIAEDVLQALEPDNFLSAGFSFSLGFGLESLGDFSLSGLVSVNVDTGVGLGFGFGATAGFGISTDVGFGFGVSSSFGFTSGFMSGLTSSTRIAMSEIQSQVNALKNMKALSPEQARAARQVARAVQKQLASAQKQMTQVPAELLSAVQLPSAICRASAYVTRVTKQINKAQTVAIRLGVVAKAKQSALSKNHGAGQQALSRDVVQTYTAKGSDTFASISVRFYKTPDRAATIAKANGFPGYRVKPPAGAILVIPTLTPSNSGHITP